MTEAEVKCDAPGVWYYGEHLAEWPVSQTAPVKWCPKCLGLGTVRVSQEKVS